MASTLSGAAALTLDNPGSINLVLAAQNVGAQNAALPGQQSNVQLAQVPATPGPATNNIAQAGSNPAQRNMLSALAPESVRRNDTTAAAVASNAFFGGYETEMLRIALGVFRRANVPVTSSSCIGNGGLKIKYLARTRQKKVTNTLYESNRSETKSPTEAKSFRDIKVEQYVREGHPNARGIISDRKRHGERYYFVKIVEDVMEQEIVSPHLDCREVGKARSKTEAQMIAFRHLQSLDPNTTTCVGMCIRDPNWRGEYEVFDIHLRMPDQP